MPKSSKTPEKSQREWHEISMHETGGRAVRAHIKQALSEESGLYEMVSEVPCTHTFWARWDSRKKELIIKTTEKKLPEK